MDYASIRLCSSKAMKWLCDWRYWTMATGLYCYTLYIHCLTLALGLDLALALGLGLKFKGLVIVLGFGFNSFNARAGVWILFKPIGL